MHPKNKNEMVNMEATEKVEIIIELRFKMDFPLEC